MRVFGGHDHPDPDHRAGSRSVAARLALQDVRFWPPVQSGQGARTVRSASRLDGGVSALADLLPGDIMFARHVTPWSADLLILAGQTFLGQPGYPHHVGVVVQAAKDMYGTPGVLRAGPRLMQAMPGGAEDVELTADYWTKDYAYLRPAYVAGYNGMALRVAAAAVSYLGTPYSFLDYAALTALRLGIDPLSVREYVTSSEHMICSQLADQALSDAGFHMFTDGRLPQDVTPSALYGRLLSLPGTQVIKP